MLAQRAAAAAQFQRGRCLCFYGFPGYSPQLTAFFTSAMILASSAAVNSFSAKAVGGTQLRSKTNHRRNEPAKYFILIESSWVTFSFPNFGLTAP